MADVGRHASTQFVAEDVAGDAEYERVRRSRFWVVRAAAAPDRFADLLHHYIGIQRVPSPDAVDDEVTHGVDFADQLCDAGVGPSADLNSSSHEITTFLAWKWLLQKTGFEPRRLV